MQELTTETLPAVPHVVFGIFNLAIPNLIFWVVVIFVFFAGCWARIPNFMTHGTTPENRRSAT